jgi:hypothetical protein
VEPEHSSPAIPVIPILAFAAIDLLLAFFLLLDGGMTTHFWLILVIGLALAGFGLAALMRRPPDAS